MSPGLAKKEDFERVRNWAYSDASKAGVFSPGSKIDLRYPTTGNTTLVAEEGVPLDSVNSV